jgi:hypothetical protein
MTEYDFFIKAVTDTVCQLIRICQMMMSEPVLYDHSRSFSHGRVQVSAKQA